MKPSTHIHRTALLCQLLCLAGLVLPGLALADDLLKDDFTASAQSDDLNFEINASGRQAGSLAGLQYLQGAGSFGATANGGFDYQTQINNGGNGKLWLVPNAFDGANLASVSPDHNFTENPGEGGFFSVAFDLNPNTGGNLSGAWGAVTIGASDNAGFGSSGTGARGQFINNPEAHFGILFKDSGEYQMFDGGTLVGEGTFPLDPSGVTDSHPVEVRVSGIGDGNPWDGAGDALVEVFRDAAASPFATYTKVGGYVDNFISLQGYSDGFNVHEFDNLHISGGTLPPVAPYELKLVGHAFDFTEDTLALTWTSKVGITYKVRTSPNLVDWEDYETGIPGQAGQTTLNTTFTQTTKAFFRVEEQMPDPQ